MPTAPGALCFILCRGLPRRAADFHPIQINRNRVLGKTFAIVSGWHLRRKQPLLVGKSFPRRTTPICTVAHSFFHLCFHHPFGLVHQVQCFLLIARVARQHFDAADQLAIHIHRHRGLMPIKRFAGALAPVPHLRIVDTNEAVLFRAFLYLTTGTPVFRSRRPADCTCPSPLPCPTSASCPAPLESYDSSHSRRVAPHQWNSSAALRPAHAARVGPETPAAHSSVSALLPSPGPTRPSIAGRILSARWPLQNSHRRMPAKTRC